VLFPLTDIRVLIHWLIFISLCVDWNPYIRVFIIYNRGALSLLLGYSRYMKTQCLCSQKLQSLANRHFLDGYARKFILIFD